MDNGQHYRRALGAFATGVALVTTDGAEGPCGIVVNSFTSVSLKPRLVLWCLGDQSDRYGVFSIAERWAVNFLSAGQETVSSEFARPGAGHPEVARFAMRDGVPVHEGALASLVCRTHDRVRLGDHLVIVGEVEAFDSAPGDALTYFRGRYGVARTED